MKKALITGITGQDGSYLAEFLLEKGYEVHGIIRRASTFPTSRLDAIYAEPHSQKVPLFLHYGDLTDSASLTRLMRKTQPEEIYHLGAQSHVRTSFDIPVTTGDVVGLGTQRLLEAIREAGLLESVKFYHASSSELFGKTTESPQNERTPFHPRSPYGCAKLYAHSLVVNYRESYGLQASCGILFNHESPRRGETFVSRKITRAATRIEAGLQEKLYLGNLDARRDWGYAKEYVAMMWTMLQHDTADDYVIATGKNHSVRDFCEAAFSNVGLDWQNHVEHDARYERPAEVEQLVGDSSKAAAVFGWQPQVGFEELVRLMIDADRRLAQIEAADAGTRP